MSSGRTGQRGFTVLELLVVIGITGLLIGLAVPGLSKARALGKRVQCLANLHALSGAAAAYAADDPGGQILPAHPIADRNVLHDEGFFDYGGATGAANVWEGKRFGPSSERVAASRPLNDLLFSRVDDSDASFDVFRCPSDEGLPRGAHTSNPRFFDAPMLNQPMFASVGTSYLGNAYRARIRPPGARAPRYFSIGPFLRSGSAIPSPGSTVLLCEAVMWYNTARPVSSGRIGWQGLPGWHSQSAQYNVAFADGHSRYIAGPPQQLSTGTDPTYEGLYLRTSQFRFDCFPARPIEDLPERIEEP